VNYFVVQDSLGTLLLATARKLNWTQQDIVATTAGGSLLSGWRIVHENREFSNGAKVILRLFVV